MTYNYLYALSNPFQSDRGEPLEIMSEFEKNLLISEIKKRPNAKKKSLYITCSFSFFVNVRSSDRQVGSWDRRMTSDAVGCRQIMVTCAPKFIFLDQKGADFPNLGTQNSTVTFFSRNKAFKGHKKAKKITTALLEGQLLLFFWGNKYEDVIDAMKKQNDDPLLRMCTNSTFFQVLLTKGTKNGRSVIFNEKAVFFCFIVIKLTCRTFLSLCL